jgi:hypothetical protein
MSHSRIGEALAYFAGSAVAGMAAGVCKTTPLFGGISNKELTFTSKVESRAKAVIYSGFRGVMFATFPVSYPVIKALEYSGVKNPLDRTVAEYYENTLDSVRNNQPRLR